MPMFTYMPQWEAVVTFFHKFEPYIPKGYTGWAGIRLHRTGNPLTFELFGKELPTKPLYPVVAFELKNGEMVKDWAKLEIDFDVPWVKTEDYDRLRNDVMTFYHTEDLLEARGETVLKEEHPAEEIMRKALIDHTQALAEV